MARSAGITVSAVVVFIGSAFTLLFGALAALGSAMMSLHTAPSIAPHLGFVVVIVEAVFALGLSGWGIATGVGLIQAKEWARISMIVFAALLALFTLPSALMMAFIPLPVPKDPNLPANFTLILRGGFVLFYGLLGALAIFWLYFFNRRSVKAQFQTKQAASEGSGPSPSEIGNTPALAGPARPLSITIIAWFLIVASAISPFSLWYMHAMFHGTPIPMFFIGFFVSGSPAILILLFWMAAQVIAAVGLLKLRNWARLATIGLQVLGVVNVLLVVGVPAHLARFQRIMNSAVASMNLRTPQPLPAGFPVWIGMVASLPLFCVILWFLVTRKRAFLQYSSRLQT